MTQTHHPYSAFLRQPTSVVTDVEEGGDVILERRDGEDMVLTSVNRFQATLYGATVATRVLRDLLTSDAAHVKAFLIRELPWLRWLPEDEQRLCVEELIGELMAGADTANMLPFARAVRAWSATAEIHSDPELANRLRGPFPGDGPAIPRPAA